MKYKTTIDVEIEHEFQVGDEIKLINPFSNYGGPIRIIGLDQWGYDTGDGKRLIYDYAHQHYELVPPKPKVARVTNIYPGIRASGTHPDRFAADAVARPDRIAVLTVYDNGDTELEDVR